MTTWHRHTTRFQTFEAEGDHFRDIHGYTGEVRGGDLLKVRQLHEAEHRTMICDLSNMTFANYSGEIRFTLGEQSLDDRGRRITLTKQGWVTDSGERSFPPMSSDQLPVKVEPAVPAGPIPLGMGTRVNAAGKVGVVVAIRFSGTVEVAFPGETYVKVFHADELTRLPPPPS